MTRAELGRVAGQRVELRIGLLQIAGSSRHEARRLADSLPGALEAAIRGQSAGARPTVPDRVAEQILAAVALAREARE